MHISTIFSFGFSEFKLINIIPLVLIIKQGFFFFNYILNFVYFLKLHILLRFHT